MPPSTHTGGGASPAAAGTDKQGSGCCAAFLRSRSDELRLSVGSTAASSQAAAFKSAPLWLPRGEGSGALPSQASAGSAGSGGMLLPGWGPLPHRASGDGEGGGAQWSSRERQKAEALQLLEDCRIPPEEIEVMKRPDGSPWQLGAGGFGTVGAADAGGAVLGALACTARPRWAAGAGH